MLFLSPINVRTVIPLPRFLDEEQNLKLRCLTSLEIKECLGIENPEYDDSGFLTSCLSLLKPVNELSHMNEPGRNKLRSAQFGIEVDANDLEQARDVLGKVNLCLRVALGDGVGLTLIKKLENGCISPSESYLYPFPANAATPVLNERDFEKIKNLISSLIKNNPDSRLSFITDFFNCAFSDTFHRGSKIIALFTVLEILFTDAKQKKRAYRLAFRASKALGKNSEFVEKMKQLYKKRGELIHEGNSKFSEEEVDLLKKTARDGMELFISSPEMFKNLHKRDNPNAGQVG